MGKTALLFAGQGAQAVGMGADFYETSPAARAVFDMGEEIAPGITALTFHGDAAELAKTENTQPCLFLTDLAIAAALRENGLCPGAVAGFSLGELPALAFSGLLTEEDAFRLVLLRGQTMAKLSGEHPGAMAAVLKLDASTVEGICGQFTEIWPVNYNCPGQISCAGSKEQMDDFCAAVKTAGRESRKTCRFRRVPHPVYGGRGERVGGTAENADSRHGKRAGVRQPYGGALRRGRERSYRNPFPAGRLSRAL